MISFYTDGSFKINNDETSDNEMCAGIGIVMHTHNRFTNEIETTQYLAYRYTKEELTSLLQEGEGVFSCFDNITSTMIECLGFVTCIKQCKEIFNRYKLETAIIYVDDIFIKRMFDHYIICITSGTLVEDSNFYGCYTCMLQNILGDDLELMNKITVQHVSAHKDNVHNNQADYLASYSTDPMTRVLNVLSNYVKETPINKKTYFLTLDKIKKGQFTNIIKKE